MRRLRDPEQHLSANPTDKEVRKQVRKLKEMIDWCVDELSKWNLRRMTYKKLAAVKQQ